MEAAQVPAETPEQTTPAAAEPAAPESTDTETPDVSEYMRNLDQRLGSIEGRLPEEEAPAGDIYDQLGSEFEEPEGEYGEPGQEAQAPQDEMDLLRSVFREEAQAIIGPHMDRQALNNFAKDHPDIREPEIFQDVMQHLAQGEERHGRGVYTDPWAVEMAYKAVKADAAAAAETPAEAGDNANPLETGAGPSAPEETDVDAEYKQKVFGEPRKRSVF